MLSETYASEEITLVWSLLIVIVVVTYIIQRNGWHWIPPASCAMVLGILAGIVGKVAGLEKPLRFSPATFFYALLPPVVFSAGFTLKKRQFFRNFGAILMFAVVGTFISSFVFGLATYLLVLLGLVRRSHLGGAPFVECLMYGSAISSIDPVATLALLANLEVPPLLYNLVFGESVLNDAVAITLFRALERSTASSELTVSAAASFVLRFCSLALGSLLVGVGVALGAAFLLKRFVGEGQASHAGDFSCDVSVGGPFASLRSEHSERPGPHLQQVNAAVAATMGGAGARDAEPGHASPHYPHSQRSPAPFEGVAPPPDTAAGPALGGGPYGGASVAAGPAPGLPTPFPQRPQSPSQPDSLEATRGHAHFDGTIYEMAIVVMSAYLAYLAAEVAGMSGIVALFFTGICHAHYSFYTVSPVARVTLRSLSEFSSFMCELFIMAYLGLQVATMRHAFDFGLIASGLPLALLSRAANIFPCAALLNRGRTHRLPRPLQTLLWASGLRGAVAYGLVVNLPRADGQGTGIDALETATLLIVVVSTLILGSATEPLLRRLDLVGKDDAALYGMALVEDDAALAWSVGWGGSQEPPDGARPQTVRLEVSERSWLHDRFKDVDVLVLKPLFGGRRNGDSEWTEVPDRGVQR